MRQLHVSRNRFFHTRAIAATICYAAAGMTRPVLSRRQMIAVLGAAGLGSRAALAADSPLRFTGLDHLEFFVSNLDRSIRFYTTVFGAELWKNRRTPRRYLKLG